MDYASLGISAHEVKYSSEKGTRLRKIICFLLAALTVAAALWCYANWYFGWTFVFAVCFIILYLIFCSWERLVITGNEIIFSSTQYHPFPKHFNVKWRDIKKLGYIKTDLAVEDGDKKKSSHYYYIHSPAYKKPFCISISDKTQKELKKIFTDLVAHYNLVPQDEVTGKPDKKGDRWINFVVVAPFFIPFFIGGFIWSQFQLHFPFEKLVAVKGIVEYHDYYYLSGRSYSTSLRPSGRSSYYVMNIRLKGNNRTFKMRSLEFRGIFDDFADQVENGKNVTMWIMPKYLNAPERIYAQVCQAAVEEEVLLPYKKWKSHMTLLTSIIGGFMTLFIILEIYGIKQVFKNEEK